ncbi:hypothetical protein BSL78_28510 [Apostichopus japonicus]|uniref:Uncharacterized protein n=1 Tax=Stichopus japonicus TaxID=307972 RepID=A0A2G8JG03_STIJA|nr:hypothetical protein BSL78_28510 [Apostichopus japonicus]
MQPANKSLQTVADAVGKALLRARERLQHDIPPISGTSSRSITRHGTMHVNIAPDQPLLRTSPHLQQCEAGPDMQCGPVPTSHKVEGISDFSSILTRLVPVLTPLHSRNSGSSSEREMEDCHPHRTVVRCDLRSLNSLQHIDTEREHQNIYTPERFTLKRVNLSRDL